MVDPKLRKILEQFHAEATEAYRAERYIAAVILCGGVLEGLLTFALTTRESDAKERLQKTVKGSVRGIPQWHLEELIEVASDLGLVGKSAAQAAPAVRDFRNMIHPYRLLRRSEPRWDALAAIALAAVAEISRSLSGRL
jgi:hypothetical protein